MGIPPALWQFVYRVKVCSVDQDPVSESVLPDEWTMISIFAWASGIQRTSSKSWDLSGFLFKPKPTSSYHIQWWWLLTLSSLTSLLLTHSHVDHSSCCCVIPVSGDVLNTNIQEFFVCSSDFPLSSPRELPFLLPKCTSNSKPFWSSDQFFSISFLDMFP